MQKTIVKGNDHPATKADRMKEIISRYAASGKTVVQYCAANKIKEKYASGKIKIEYNFSY